MEIIDAGIQKASEKTHLVTHYIISTAYYDPKEIQNIFTIRLHKSSMKFAIVTVLEICRLKLVTKETMVAHHKGRFSIEHSVNDDLDFFFEGLQLGLVCNERINTFCFPKLNETEMKLMNLKDEHHLNSHSWYLDGGEEEGEDFSSKNPDVNESEMRLSGSKSKYVDILCDRSTFVIQNRPKNYSDHDSDETDASENQISE